MHFKANELTEVPLVVISADFRQVPTSLRGVWATTKKDRKKFFKKHSIPGKASGFVSLETCNRVEWFLSTDDPSHTADYFSSLMQSKWKDLCNDSNLPSPKIYKEAPAVEHTFRVISGLESLVPGEVQIVKQFHGAMNRAQEEKTSSPLLNVIGSLAGKMAKLARKSGFQSDHKKGIHGLTTQFIQHWFGEDIKSKTILLTGMGEIGRKTARLLKKNLKCKIISINRTIPINNKNKWKPFSELKKLIAEADAMVVATGSLEPTISAKHFSTQGNYPFLIVDIGMPRQVDEKVENLSCIEYKNIDHLCKFNSHAHPPINGQPLETLIQKYVAHFKRYCISQTITPLLDKTRRHYENSQKIIPQYIDAHYFQLGKKERKILAEKLKLMFRFYQGNMFRSINNVLDYYSNP